MAPAPITAMRALTFSAVMAQRPLKLGVRFSMKALTPSR
jgi:hypothetical protein